MYYIKKKANYMSTIEVTSPFDGKVGEVPFTNEKFKMLLICTRYFFRSENLFQNKRVEILEKVGDYEFTSR